MSFDNGPSEEASEVVLGLVAAPGAPTKLADSLRSELVDDLSGRSPGVRWRVEQEENPLVRPPADDSEIVSAARDLLLARGWDLVVFLTDLPLRVARRPVVAHASPLQGVAVLSLPALGAVNTRRRAHQRVVGLVDGLLGAPETPDEGADRPWAERRTRRLHALGTDAGGDGTLRFTTRVLTGNLNLLVGMVRANRPWRLAVGLSRALVAALTAGVFALVTPDVWRLADAYGAWRLSAVALGSVAAIVTTLILGADLWERVRHQRMRQQVVLFNVATTATVVIGVLVFYLALFVLAFLATLLLVVPSLFEQTLGHHVGLADYAELAWLTSSLATAGGALGAGLESDESVREAAYIYRVDPGTEQERLASNA